MLSVLINLDSHYVHIRFDYVWLFKHTYVHMYVHTTSVCRENVFTRQLVMYVIYLYIWKNFGFGLQ